MNGIVVELNRGKSRRMVRLDIHRQSIKQNFLSELTEKGRVPGNYRTTNIWFTSDLRN